MSALKVGDRVHVEFDATVVKVPYNPVFDFVEVRDGQDVILLAQRVVTKLVDPEPVWALGDVVRVGGELVLTLMDLGHGGMFCWVGVRQLSAQIAHHSDTWMSVQWELGKVQRLVPGAQK